MIVIKWAYFALVAVFLAAVLWMLNDMRLRVNGLVDQVDEKLPRILNNSEQAVQRINDQLPLILKNSKQAALDINAHLPKILLQAQLGVSQLANLGKSFRDFKNLFAGLAAPPKHKDHVRVAKDLQTLVEEQIP